MGEAARVFSLPAERQARGIPAAIGGLSGGATGIQPIPSIELSAQVNAPNVNAEGEKVMATESEVRAAEIAAAEARTDTKIVRMEGKLDLVISKIDGLNIRFEDVRSDARETRATAHSDNVATRANIWVVGIGLAVLIVAVAALFPVFFGIGANQRFGSQRNPTSNYASQVSLLNFVEYDFLAADCNQ